jgi:hypothetical protein
MPNNLLRQPNFAALVTLVWLLVALALLLQFWTQTAETLLDTDDATRLAQLRGWLGGQGWFDLHQARMQPPEGYDTHWSRLIDAGLAGLLFLFGQFTDGASAERLMRAWWPLLWLWPTIAGMAAIADLARVSVVPGVRRRVVALSSSGRPAARVPADPRHAGDAGLRLGHRYREDTPRDRSHVAQGRDGLSAGRDEGPPAAAARPNPGGTGSLPVIRPSSTDLLLHSTSDFIEGRDGRVTPLFYFQGATLTPGDKFIDAGAGRVRARVDVGDQPDHRRVAVDGAGERGHHVAVVVELGVLDADGRELLDEHPRQVELARGARGAPVAVAARLGVDAHVALEAVQEVGGELLGQ